MKSIYQSKLSTAIFIALSLSSSMAYAATTTGPTGPAGPTGAKGPAGPTGAKGATGSNGLNGATGAQGPAGATGLQGIAGATGAQGPAGPTGPSGLGTIAHSAPVIVDANGQYIATLISGGITGFNSIEARGIIEQSDIFIYLSTDSLGFTIQDNDVLSYWENSSCSGEATITMPYTFNTIMTLSAFSLSPDPNYYGGMNMLGRDLTGFYYIPANIDQAYTGSVYTWNGLACVLAPPASQTQMYVKPLLNNPTVTGFDPAILKLPFKITTNY